MLVKIYVTPLPAFVSRSVFYSDKGCLVEKALKLDVHLLVEGAPRDFGAAYD